MTYIRTAVAISVLVTCSGVASMASEYTQIKKKAEFAQAAVGKKLTADWGWVIVKADGSITGDAGGQAISGNWNWKGRMYCRTITVGSEDRGNDCQTVHVSGKNIVFIRDRGKGDQLPMKIK